MAKPKKRRSSNIKKSIGSTKKQKVSSTTQLQNLTGDRDGSPNHLKEATNADSDIEYVAETTCDDNVSHDIDSKASKSEEVAVIRCSQIDEPETRSSQKDKKLGDSTLEDVVLNTPHEESQRAEARGEKVGDDNDEIKQRHEEDEGTQEFDEIHLSGSSVQSDEANDRTLSLTEEISCMDALAQNLDKFKQDLSKVNEYLQHFKAQFDVAKRDHVAFLKGEAFQKL